jgi:prolyl oligopeptidase
MIACALASGPLASAAASANTAQPPSGAMGSTGGARIEPVHDTVGKIALTDNYRWMEDDPQHELAAYLRAATAQTDAALSHIAGRDRMRHALTTLDAASVSISALTPDGDTLYYLKQGLADDVAKLVLRRAQGVDEKILVDPEMLPDAKPHSEIDQFAPSPDGNYVAYGLEYAGPDTSTLRIYDAIHNVTLAERINGARFAQVTWSRESEGFYYTRAVSPSPLLSPATPPVLPPGAPPAAPAAAKPALAPTAHLGVFFHILGNDPAKDAPVLDGARLPFAGGSPDAIPRLLIVPGSDWALAMVSDGVSPDLTVAAVRISQLKEQPAPWQLVAAPADGVTQVVANGSILFLLTSANADRLRVATEDLEDPGFEHARTIVPETEGVITGMAAAKDALYIARRQGAAMHLLRLDYNDAQPQDVRLPYAGTIAPVYGSGTAREWGGLVADPRSEGAFFSLESWDHPLIWMRYDTRLHRALNMGLLPDPKIDASHYATLETTAQAADGTSIPLSIIARKDAPMDHARPTLVVAFGSYGYAFDPRYMPMALAWADQGGVFAVAHVRGGGELGENWHQAGTLARKANAAADLITCATYLVRTGYTAPPYLAAMGTNAGALAVGNAMTQRPDLFRAILIRDGLNNPLRAELKPGHDIDSLELGDVRIPLQQAAVLSIDPYAQVKDGLAYPSVLLTASVNDVHEAVWQTAKLAARLQAATTSGHPILMRIAFDEGPHGPTRAQRDDNEADELSFLLWQLGAPAFQPGAAPDRHGHRGRRAAR